MFYSVQQGSWYILSLTNQRSSFEVRRLQHHQQIKAHGQHMVVVILFGQRNRWRVSSICMIMSSLSGFSILTWTICNQTLHETCYLIYCVNWQGSWYKKLHDTSIAILALPCNRAFTEYVCHKWRRVCSVCCNYNTIISSFMTLWEL